MQNLRDLVQPDQKPRYSRVFALLLLTDDVLEAVGRVDMLLLMLALITRQFNSNAIISSNSFYLTKLKYKTKIYLFWPRI